MMLAGAGAEQYARELGMDTCDILTEQSRQAWMEWRKTSNYAPSSTLRTTTPWNLGPGRRRWPAMHHNGLQDARPCRRQPHPGGEPFRPEVGGATATGLGEAC